MLSFIRPSSLAIAEKCLLSPALAARFPTTNNANIQKGQQVDSQASTELRGGPPATDPDAVECVKWIRAHMAVTHVQEEVTLNDELGQFLLKGTPDVVGVDSWDQSCLIVCDLKKIHQYRNSYIDEPDENLQLNAYALSHRAGFTKYRTVLLLFGDGPLEAVWSKEKTEAEWGPILERIARVQIHAHESGAFGPGDATLPLPQGRPGDHCLRCHQRAHCSHWLLPVPMQESALEPLSRPDGLSPKTIERAYLAWKATKELAERAEGLIKAYREKHGPGSVTVGDKCLEPVTMRGRKTADVARLVADGLSGYIREGDTYESWRLVRRK